jgi:hypothetical protein
MPIIRLILDGDGMLEGVDPKRLAHTTEPIAIGALAGGMKSGKPSVAIAMYLPNNGGCVLGETSLALFLATADALKARFGDPR